MRKRFFLCCIFSSIFLGSFTSNDDCKSLLSKALNELNKAQFSVKEKGLFLDYRVKTYFKSGDKEENAEERVRAFAKKDKSYLSSSKIEIYKDGFHQVSILKDKKKIIIAQLRADDRSEVKVNALLGIQDSLVKNSHILTCSRNAKNNQKAITLVPDKKVQEKTGIEKAIFFIDNPNQFKKVTMTYLKGRPVKEIELEILDRNYNYPGEAFTGRAINKVLSREGKLLSPFTTYRLIDLRK